MPTRKSIAKMKMLTPDGVVPNVTDHREGKENRQMGKSKTTRSTRKEYQSAARIWLALSQDASGSLAHKLPCTFIGAYVYSCDSPVTIYEISKLWFVSGWAQAKRLCDEMVNAGAFDYNDAGAVVITDRGRQTSDYYFKRLFEMPDLVHAMHQNGGGK